MKRDVLIISLVCIALVLGGGTWLACVMFGWEAGLAFSMLAIGWIGLVVAREKHKSDKMAALDKKAPA